VLPDQDAVIAITSETSDMQNELNLIWEYLLPAIKTEKLAENKALNTTLKQKLKSLKLPLAASGNSPAVSRISGRTFAFETNEKLIESMKFQFNDSICGLSLVVDSKNYNLVFGAGHWAKGETTLPGPDLLMAAQGHFVGLPPSKIMGNFEWKDGNILELVLRYIESPHTMIITCTFDNNKTSVGFKYSNQPGNVEPPINGQIKD
jgi:hypothetical protein